MIQPSSDPTLPSVLIYPSVPALLFSDAPVLPGLYAVQTILRETLLRRVVVDKSLVIDRRRTVQTILKHKETIINTHTHTHIYIYIYICILCTQSYTILPLIHKSMCDSKATTKHKCLINKHKQTNQPKNIYIGNRKPICTLKPNNNI